MEDVFDEQEEKIESKFRKSTQDLKTISKAIKSIGKVIKNKKI